MRENVEQKARRYLAEGRLTILHLDELGIVAICKGGGAFYNVRWSPERSWSCDCPAKGACAHMRALQQVTVRQPEREE
jgi:uncharacterized Zn finger protein